MILRACGFLARGKPFPSSFSEWPTRVAEEFPRILKTLSFAQSIEVNCERYCKTDRRRCVGEYFHGEMAAPPPHLLWLADHPSPAPRQRLSHHAYSRLPGRDDPGPPPSQ